MPKVNHEILAWARKTAGLTLEEAVRKLGIKHARGMNAIAKLSTLENGETDPTRPTLVKMAKQYRRPLITFYLSKPPWRSDRGTDFRTLSDKPTVSQDAFLDMLIRNVQVRQSMIQAVMEDEDEAQPLSFIGSGTMSEGQLAVLNKLKLLLNIKLSDFRAQPGARAAFNLLRNATENVGVFVILKGDLGSYHTAIDTEYFRGFSISDEVAPFVIINDRDALSAWSFTLLHELVHLLLGQTGVGNIRTEKDIEIFCDNVAGEFLLPSEELEDLDLNAITDLDSTIEEQISKFAHERNVSHTMVTYRAYRVGIIKQETFHFLLHQINERHKQSKKSKELKSGPDYYVVRRHRIGSALITLVGRMMASGALSTTKAARILEVKPTQIQRLLELSDNDR